MYFFMVCCSFNSLGDSSLPYTSGFFTLRQTRMEQKRTSFEEAQQGIIFSMYFSLNSSCSFSEKQSKYFSSSLLKRRISSELLSSAVVNYVSPSKKQFLRCPTSQGEACLSALEKSRLKKVPLDTLFLSKIIWNLFILPAINSRRLLVDTLSWQQYFTTFRMRGMWKSRLFQSTCLWMMYFWSASAKRLDSGVWQLQMFLMMKSSSQLCMCPILAITAFMAPQRILREKCSQKLGVRKTAFAIFSRVFGSKVESASLSWMGCRNSLYQRSCLISSCTQNANSTPLLSYFRRVLGSIFCILSLGSKSLLMLLRIIREVMRSPCVPLPLFSPFISVDILFSIKMLNSLLPSIPANSFGLCYGNNILAANLRSSSRALIALKATKFWSCSSVKGNLLGLRMMPTGMEQKGQSEMISSQLLTQLVFCSYYSMQILSSSDFSWGSSVFF